MKRILPIKFITAVMAAYTILTCVSPVGVFAMESRSSTNLRGIDVSHWDGFIDWTKVAQNGIRFAYIKASGGYSFVDPLFAINVRNARKNGIAVGAYDYVKPTGPFNSEQPVAQATFFVNTMKSAMSDYGDIMPVMDVEQTGSLSTHELVRWIGSFSDTVEKLTHRQVMLYTSVDFIERHEDLDNQLHQLPLWVAYYDRLNGGKIPPNVAGWTQWSVWQYSDLGKVNGISGSVDINAGPTSLALIRGDLTPTETTHKVKVKEPPKSALNVHSKPTKNLVASQTKVSNRWASKALLVGTIAIALIALALLAALVIVKVTRKRRGYRDLQM